MTGELFQFQLKKALTLDILGFKKLVKESENGMGMILPELIELPKCLGTPDNILKFKKFGPTICPASSYINRDLDFKLTQITDCVIVSSEISPAGVINLVNHCWGAVLKLLQKGIMCRGYITKGSIYHTESQIIGSGYTEAVSREKTVKAFKRVADKIGTPYVELDPIVCKYVKDCDDRCVKEMFSRFVKEDGDLVALFPFEGLSHSFLIAGFGIKFDPNREKSSNQKMRILIKELKNRILEFVDKANPDAIRKSKHYIKALNNQLAVCDKTDEIIGKLS
jgi:hypothetical protein